MSGESSGVRASGKSSRGGAFAGFVLGVIIGAAIGAWFGSGGMGFMPAPGAAASAVATAKPVAAVTGATPAVAAKTPAVVDDAPADSGPQTASAASLIPTRFDMPPADHRITIGVFGDSMADGLWAGLYREMRDGKNYDVVRFSQPSTGISRYDYVDIQQKTTDQLATRHVDIAVVLFGTNDEQGIIDGRNVYAFNTPGWRQVYLSRIDNLVALLRRNGARVYWVGLPKMGRDGFDARAGILNSIYASRMAQLGVPFISTVPYTVDAKGGYDAYLPADGRRTLMRAKDGIHMTMAGYMRIASPVTQRIRADLGALINRRGGGGTTAAPAAIAPGDTPAPGATP